MSARDVFRKVLEVVQSPAEGFVSADEVRSWMSDPDIEVQGAAYQVFRKQVRITPEISREEQSAFFKQFLERCLHEGIEGDWTYSSYSACWEVAGWMASLLDDAVAAATELDDLRDWLASLYVKGTPSERDALLNGALEHLLEREELREHFRPWKNDPELAQVYADACLWSDEGGDSPIVGRTGLRRRPNQKQ